MHLSVVGLGTMGANLARNAARNGARVAVFNRTTSKVEEFLRAYGSEGQFTPCATLQELAQASPKPRAILLMVKAGQPVDDLIAEIGPLLDPGDVLIDAGNSHYRDTDRRQRELRVKGISFLGMGVSGGEEGALRGPSLMPGGDQEAYQMLEPLLVKVAADDGGGGRCVTYVGPGGSGHFVKMVHNGIEYGLLQLIAESYDLLRSEGKFGASDLAETFAMWNQGELQSFLIESAATVFAKKDEGGGAHLIDLIADRAEQKGTGKWTVGAAMEYGVATPTIDAAVDARILSGSDEERERRTDLPEVVDQPYPKPEKLRSRVRIALELSSYCTYTQGFRLLAKASQVEEWNLNLTEIARIWRGGCIIRSAVLPKLQDAYGDHEGRAKIAKEEILERFRGERQLDWRKVVALGLTRGIPLPAMCASLAYYDALRRPRLPQNLIQALRDLFGAHTYERIDRPGMFHTEWHA